jgi:hypothetical protein
MAPTKYAATVSAAKTSYISTDGALAGRSKRAGQHVLALLASSTYTCQWHEIVIQLPISGSDLVPSHAYSHDDGHQSKGQENELLFNAHVDLTSPSKYDTGESFIDGGAQAVPAMSVLGVPSDI